MDLSSVCEGAFIIVLSTIAQILQLTLCELDSIEVNEAPHWGWVLLVRSQLHDRGPSVTPQGEFRSLLTEIMSPLSTVLIHIKMCCFMALISMKRTNSMSKQYSEIARTHCQPL
ncbi:unnamed protein product [Lepidochelys kempii]